MRFALVNKENVVVNVIMWDGANFVPPTDHYIVKSDTANIGNIFNHEDMSFSQPVVKDD